MSEENLSQQEVSEIYPDFVDWVTPTDISLNREELAFRWQTINRVFIDEDGDSIDTALVDDLIISALGFMQSKPSALDKIRDEIRKDDIMFPGGRGSRDEELKVLSSYSLRLLIDDSLYDDSFSAKNATKILSASLNGIKSYKGGIDLVDFTKNKCFNYARELRERIDLKSPSFSFKFSLETEEILEEIENTAPNSTAILAVSKELRQQLNTANMRMISHVEALNTENEKAAEEQEILWFITLGWSENFDTHYSELLTPLRIFDFANALSSRTHLNVELPSLKALANKVGIESEVINFRVWVETVISEYPKAIDECQGEPSELTPCLYAIKLASQGHWYNKWNENIGLDNKFEINSLELAQQIYREFLVLRWSK